MIVDEYNQTVTFLDNKTVTLFFDRKTYPGCAGRSRPQAEQSFAEDDER